MMWRLKVHHQRKRIRQANLSQLPKPIKRCSWKNLRKKIVAGENISDMSGDSIALPYTVVDVSKFPPKTQTSTGVAAPKLPNTPAPTSTTASSSYAMKNSELTGKPPNSTGYVSSTPLNDKTNAAAKYSKQEKGKLPATSVGQASARPHLATTGTAAASAVHKPEPRSSCVNVRAPRMPVVLRTEADKSKDGTRSPRKVPVMIHNQDTTSKDTYEPVNIEKFNFSFADEDNSASKGKKITNQEPSLLTGAKTAYDARQAFLTSTDANHAKTAESPSKESAAIELSTDKTPAVTDIVVASDKVKATPAASSEKVADKQKKAGKGFFRKLLRIGSKGGEAVEGRGEEEGEAVSPTKSVDSVVSEEVSVGDANPTGDSFVADTLTGPTHVDATEELYENTAVIGNRNAAVLGDGARKYFSPFASSINAEKTTPLTIHTTLPGRHDPKPVTASVTSVDKRSPCDAATAISPQSSPEDSANRLAAKRAQANLRVETGTQAIRNKTRTPAVKKPGVPPPAAPPSAPTSAQTKSPQLSTSTTRLDSTNANVSKIPATGDGSIIGTDFGSEILGLLQEFSATNLPSLGDQFSSDTGSGLEDDKSLASPSLGVTNVSPSHDDDSRRRKGNKCARSESRNSKILRSKMGAPPPPPPADSDKRHSASDLGGHPTDPAMTSSLHITNSCGSFGANTLHGKPKTVLGSPGKGSSLPRDLAMQKPFSPPCHQRKSESCSKEVISFGASADSQERTSNSSLDAKQDDYDIGRLLENRTSSRFMNRALPLPPASTDGSFSESENFYEFVPSDGGKYSAAGTPLSEGKTCYEDIDIGDIYDDPADLSGAVTTSGSISYTHTGSLQVSGPLSPGGYLEPAKTAKEYELCKTWGGASKDSSYPDIIPTSGQHLKNGSTSTLPAQGRIPPALRSQTSEPTVTSTRMTQDYFMPYVNMEMAMDPGTPARNFTEGLTKMSAINSQTMHIIIEEAFTSYLCMDAKFHNDLVWRDFVITPGGMELSVGDFGFYKAKTSKLPHGKQCYLMISSKSIPSSLLNLCYINVINPCAIFCDKLSRDLFPEPLGKSHKIRQPFAMETTSIAVLPYLKITGLRDYIRTSHVKSYGTGVLEYDHTVCYLMAQILNGLLYLHGKQLSVKQLNAEDILLITAEHGELYPVLNPASLTEGVVNQESQLFDSIVEILLLLLKIRKKAWESVSGAISKRTVYSTAFQTLVSMLHQKQFTHQSLVTARNILEFMLWGPDEQELKTLAANKSPQDGYSVWLEVSRCRLINEIALSRAPVSLEQANQMQFLCSVTGKSLVDVVKILNE